MGIKEQLENRKKVRKTFKGMLSTMYSNMKQRTRLKQYSELISKQDFINFAYKSIQLKILYNNWLGHNCARSFAPSIDRVNETGEYTKDNIQFLTQKANTSKSQSINPRHPTKPTTLFNTDTKEVLTFNSRKSAGLFLGQDSSCVSRSLVRKATINKVWKVFNKEKGL